MKKRTLIANIFITLFLALIAFIVVVPVIYTILGSFKSNAEMLAHPDWLIPREPTFDNYKTALQAEEFNVPRMMWNSIYYSVICTAAAVVFSAMAGYAFARHDFPGSKLILTVFTGLMFLNVGGITFYPKFEVINLLGIGNSLWGLIFMKLFSVNIVQIILVKSYVTTLPRSLDESAELDGCNFVQIFFRIIMPLLKPIIATITILFFNGTWNDYIMPSIFTMSRPDQRPLIAGVVALKNTEEGASSWTLMLAGSTVALIPVLIIYTVGNKYMVSGLAAGAVKG